MNQPRIDTPDPLVIAGVNHASRLLTGTGPASAPGLAEGVVG